MQSSYLEFEFGKIHYLHTKALSNTAKKTILFLHAFHSSAKSYLPVCELLKDQFNLLCLDFPGHGLSEPISVERHAWYYSMEGFVSVLLQFIEHLQLKNLVIVGDSVGGNCAIRAMQSLKMLEGLVIEGSAQAESVEALFALHHSSGPIKFLFQKEFSNAECNAVAAAYVNPQKNNGKNFQQMIYDIQHTDPNCREQFSHFLKTQAWVDELKLIQNCSVPLMYILGKQDGFINSDHYANALVKAGIKRSTIHVLNQVRHIPHLDDPKNCAHLIKDFVDRL